MSEQELTAKMDEALAHVDPDRRKFLGILLAGVAAAPLLTSASLAAQDATGAHFPKNATAAKGNTELKNNNDSIKLTNAGAHKNNSDIWIKNDAGIKNTNNAIKNTNAGTHKNSSATPDSLTFGREKTSTSPIKASTGTGNQTKNSGANPAWLKSETKPLKSETKPAPQ
jgi:hypothetical protein